MSEVSCPSCSRKGTYSPKHKQCAACGLGYPLAPKVVSMVPDDVRPEVLHDGRITPVTERVTNEQPVTPGVTERVTVTPSVTNGEDVTAVVTPCEYCGCPGHPKAKSNVERQRAYRERKEG